MFIAVETFNAGLGIFVRFARGSALCRPIDTGLWLYLGLALALLSGACTTLRVAGPSESTLIARQQLLAALEAAERADWTLAEELLRAAHDLAPHDERVMYQLSRVLWQQGRQPEAVQLMERAVAWSGNNASWLIDLGWMRLAIGEDQAAEQLARQALRSPTIRGQAYGLLGDIMAQRGQLEDALSYYHRALDSGNRDAKVTLAVAEIYRAQGQPWRLLSTLQACDRSSLAGDDVGRYWYLLAMAHRELHHLPDALFCLQRAVECSATQWEWRIELARTLWQTGRVPEAQAHLEAVQQAIPNHPAARQLADEMSEASLASLHPINSLPADRDRLTETR